MGSAARAVKAKTKVPPVSVAVTKEQREEFASEARRRGLGISTTIRNLAVERTTQLRDERQRERARRWQTQRMLTLADRIESGQVGEASREEIDRIFEEAETPAAGPSAVSANG